MAPNSNPESSESAKTSSSDSPVEAPAQSAGEPSAQSPGKPSSQSPAETASVRDWLVVYLKGCAIGAADTVPGISGGTIALITGIYERLIRALTGIDITLLEAVPTLYRSSGRREFRRLLLDRDVAFLVVLGLGMGTAVVLISRVVHAALVAIPALAFAFFAGLIGASAVVLFEARWLMNPRHLAASIAGFTAAFIIAGASSAGFFPESAYMAFFAGAVAICGMLLPGISGAFILLLLGQLEFLTGVLTRFVNNLLGIGAEAGTAQLVADGLVVAAFMAGALAGLFTIAYVVRRALATARVATFAFLVSLMVGALRYPAERIFETAGSPPGSILAVVGAGIVGVALVLVLDRYTDDLAYEGTGGSDPDASPGQRDPAE